MQMHVHMHMHNDVFSPNACARKARSWPRGAKIDAFLPIACARTARSRKTGAKAFSRNACARSARSWLTGARSTRSWPTPGKKSTILSKGGPDSGCFEIGIWQTPNAAKNVKASTSMWEHGATNAQTDLRPGTLMKPASPQVNEAWPK